MAGVGATSRTKGKAGERDVANLLADLTGWDIRRRVRQHEGDADLECPGWAIEVKRHKTASRAEIRGWWEQAVQQAERTGQIPCLAFRRDRDDWRMVWPISVHLTGQKAEMWTHYCWAVEGSPEAWASVARELVSSKPTDILGGIVLSEANHVREGQEGQG